MNGERRSIGESIAKDTHEHGEEVTLLPSDRRATTMRARAFTFAQLAVKAEEEALLASFGTALHPLTLCHQR